jgi:hypothetical protein
MNEMSNWRKASYSQGASNCVETGSKDGSVAIRDTKDRSAVLTVSATSWSTFLVGIKRA